MSTDSQLATAPVTPGFHKATSALSAALGIEPRMMIETLKKQCFPNMKPEEISDPQLAAFISVANTLNLNPLIPGMMYGYPSRNGGIVPMMGPDGVYQKLSDHADVVAQKDGGPAFWTEYTDGKDALGDTCTAFINHRVKGLLKKTIWVAEWIVSSNPNWQTRRHHMAEVRALKQAARLVIHGLPMDPDELALHEMQNVTPGGAGAQEQSEAPKRPDAPARSKKGAAAVVENKQADPKPADKTIEVETKPVAETKPAAMTVAEAAKTTATTPPAHEPPTSQPVGTPDRAFLKDAEEVTCICEVVEVTPLMMAMRPAGGGEPETKPSVKVILKGGYNGEATHHGGGTGAPPEMGWIPLWEPGNAVKVKLVGKLQPMPTDPKKVTKYSGKVVVRVMDVQQEGSPVVPVEAVE